MQFIKRKSESHFVKSLDSFIFVLVLLVITPGTVQGHRQVGQFDNPYHAFTLVAVHKGYSHGVLQQQSFPTVGLNISVPSDWRRALDAGSINEIARYLSPRQGQADLFLDNLIITLTKYRTNQTLSEITSKNLKDLSYLNRFHLITMDNATIDSKPVSNIVYSFVKNRNLFSGMQLGLLLGNSYLSFTYTAELGKYAEYLSTVKEILSSIKIDQSALTGEARVFESAKDGFSLVYPANWTRGPPDYLSSAITIYGPLENLSDNYFDNIRISVQNVSAGNTTEFSLHNNFKELVNNYTANLKNFKVLQMENQSLSGKSALSITYNFTANDKIEHKIKIISTINNNKLYSGVYDSTNRSFGPILDGILSSFKFTNSR